MNHDWRKWDRGTVLPCCPCWVYGPKFDDPMIGTATFDGTRVRWLDPYYGELPEVRWYIPIERPDHPEESYEDEMANIPEKQRQELREDILSRLDSLQGEEE